MSAAHNNRGVKRKRHEFTVQTRDIGARITGKLHHDMKEIRKAAKKAKAFETQKLVRKLKGLKLQDNQEEDIQKFEAELEVLKNLSLDAVANTAVKSKLSKDKILSENEHIQALLLQQFGLNLLEPAVPQSQAAKVQSRFLSSKLLATEVASTVENLRLILNPRTLENESQQDDSGNEMYNDIRERPKKIVKLSQAERSVPMANTSEGIIDEEDIDDAESGWESGTVDDEEENGDGWESGSISGDGSMNPVQSIRSEPKTRTTTTKSNPGTAVSNGQSTFLPSLSVGFIPGAGDSDWSDAEDADDVAPKKNRRGQRARQAIWEKKFGKNANHKKKEAEEQPARGKKTWTDARATSRGGGTSADNRSARRNTSRTQAFKPPQGTDAGWGQQIHAPPSKLMQPPKPTSTSEKLHPSWEAKKRLQEIQSASISTSLQKRKIKF